MGTPTTYSGIATDLRPGDIWSWGQQGGIEVTQTDLTDDGRIKITGRIVSGRDHGHRDSWSVQFTQPVEYDR